MHFDSPSRDKWPYCPLLWKITQLTTLYTTGGGHPALRERGGSFSTAHFSAISTEPTSHCWLCCACNVETCPGRPGWKPPAHRTPAGPAWGAGLKQGKETKGPQSSLQPSKTSDNSFQLNRMYVWNRIKDHSIFQLWRFPLFNIFGNVSDLKSSPAIAGDKRDALHGGVN